MASSANGNSNQQLVVSYVTLRRLIGILGMLLPIMLLFYSVAIKQQRIEMSISLYYFTEMRNEFIIILSLLSLFLLCYQGYDNDRIFTRITGFLGLVVALVHTTWKNSDFPCEKHGLNLRDVIHLGSAIIFFSLLAWMSFSLFTKTTDENNAKGTLPKKKKIRNYVYRICAIVMFLCIAVMVIYYFVPSMHDHLCTYKPFFWLESILLWAFGFSWLVKGETLWKD